MLTEVNRLRENIYKALENADYAQARQKINALSQIAPGEALGLLTAMEIERGDADRAQKAWQALYSILPHDVYTLFLQARISYLRHEHVSALKILEALASRDIPAIYQEKVYNLLGQCYRFLGMGEKSADAYLQASRTADGRELAVMEYSNYLFNLHYQELSLAAEKQVAGGYNDFFADVKMFVHAPRAMEQAVLRIGYVSPDFRDHVLLNFVYALLTKADKSRFRIYIYYSGREDDYSRKIAAYADEWKNIRGLSAERAAKLIYDDGIDILVDFSGHGKDNCLPVFAYHPAPLQLSGIGYFASTGLGTMDYFLSDGYLAAKGAQQGFTEELLLLPHSHFCYTPKKNVPSCTEPPFLRNGYVVFGSFNNFTKLSDTILAAWKEILEQVPQSHLILKADVFSYAESADYAQKKLAEAGLPMDRVECRPVSRDYLQEYCDIDIALDTYPYPGGGTSCDALYMGVPLISLAGVSHGSRFGFSLLSNLDLVELCAEDIPGYIQRAVWLADNHDLLQELHRTLRSRMKNSPLMCGSGYVKEMEAAYEKIWHQYVFERAEYSRSRMEELVAACLDGGQTIRAEQVLIYMLKAYGQTAYGEFLWAALYEQKKEQERALIYVEKAIKSGGLNKGQLGAAYHLLGNLYRGAGRRKEATWAYLASSKCKDLSTGQTVDYSNYLLNMAFYEEDRQKKYQAALGYGKLLAGIKPLPAVQEYGHRKLRIGYLSADFNRHVMACFMQALFYDYDGNLYEVYGYQLGESDALTRTFAERAVEWRILGGLSSYEAARIIRGDEIDILVELGGHTAHNGLPILAYKPAPVQISGLGYFATTGLAAVDYFLTDVYTAPRTEDKYFCEKLLRLPQSHLCWKPLPGMPVYLSPLPAKRRGYITFGSLNQWDKVTDEMLGAWGRILQDMPAARLYLKSSAFDDVERKAQTKARMKKCGIDSARVQLLGRSDDYMNAYLDIDIALDAYPYPGGGTTCDALYMGVPVVSLRGESHHSRFGYSLLSNAGLAEICVADSFEEYAAKAVKLGRDINALCDLRQNLRRRLEQTPVMNGRLYMRDLENAYESVWERAKEGESASAKSVLPMVEECYHNKQWQELIIVAVRNYARATPAEQLALARFLAFAYYQQKNYVKTCLWTERALEADKEDQQMLYLQASSLEQMGDLVKAIQIAEASLVKRQNLSPELYKLFCHLRSLAGYKMGHPKMTEFYWHSYLAEHDVNMYSSYLLTFNCQDVDEAELYRKSRAYGELFSETKQFSHIGHRQHKKLRIGYISPDFRLHVMYKFYQVMLGGHDGERFSVYAYSLTNKRDEYTALCANMVDNWRDMGDKSPQEAAECIYKDEIDILVDLAGHTAGGSLPIMALKPAPIQISGLGYMATTGLPAIDYFLTDSFVDPPGMHDECFVEKLLRLKSQFCYTPELADLPAAEGTPCRERGWILFGVFNAYRKFTEPMLSLWQEILEKVANSKLLVKCQVFFSPAMVEEAYRRFAQAGFDMERVIFEPATREYMERYLDVDIALDTYPYPGGGTTCDALYMGVPVIALCSERHSTRFSYSILSNAGLGELTSVSSREYVEKAVALANETELLDILHKNLRNMMLESPVMRQDAYVKELEAHYEKLWQAYGKGD